MERSFQFGLRNLLWAMTWLAVWFGMWRLPSLVVDQFLEMPPLFVVLLLIAYCYAVVATPFIAIGALLGNQKRGLRIGVMVTSIGIIVLFVVAGSGIFIRR